MTGTAPFVRFTSTAASGITLGADALRYVMAHGHCLSIPDQALAFAEKAAVSAVARTRDAEGHPLDPAPAVLAAVNTAMDLIAGTLRRRAQLDREAAAEPAKPVPVTPSRDVPGGHAVRTVSPVPTRPPLGTHATVPF